MIKLVDSNILIYAVQTNDVSKHEIAKELIINLAEKNELCLSVQNIVELSRVLLEKASPPVASEQVLLILHNLVESASIISYNSDTISKAVLLSSNYKIHFFDSLLIATMQENNVVEIITENTSDFKKFKFLKITNPFD